MASDRQQGELPNTVGEEPPDEESAVPEAVADVVVTEEPIEAGPAAGPPGAVVALVFGGDDQPGECTLEEASEQSRDPDKLVWVDLNDYGEEDLRRVGEALGLATRAVSGALAGWQRPQIKHYPDQFFVNVTIAFADVEQRVVEARELDCVVGQSFFVTAHKADLPFAGQVRERAEQNVDLIRGDAAFMLFIVLDELLNAYDRVAEGIEDEIHLMEERALVSSSDRLLSELLHLKRFVFAVHRLAEQHRETLAGFLRPDFTWVAGEDVEPYFRDLQAHHADLLGRLSAARTGANDAFNIYVSQVAHRTNYIVKVLTMVSAILLPMTAVFGLFGTNFKMGRMYNAPYFWLMLVSVLLLSGGILVLFRVRRWF